MKMIKKFLNLFNLIKINHKKNLKKLEEDYNKGLYLRADGKTDNQKLIKEILNKENG